MATLAVIKMYKENYECVGSCLRTASSDVAKKEFGNKWLENLIFDMFETLYSNSSGVGLAANQIGVLKKICVVDIKRDGKKPLVLINPEYEPMNDELIDSQEVCLSFPNVASHIKRYKKISVTYQDFYGQEHNLVAEGFKATVLQHEIDHLKGIIHIDLSQSEPGLTDYEGYSVKLAQNALNSIIQSAEGAHEDERQ